MTGTRRNPGCVLLTHLFTMSLAQCQRRVHSHSSCAVARSCASAYKGRGSKGKVLSVLCPRSRVPMDRLEGPCPYLWTVPAVRSSSRSAVGTSNEPDCLPGMCPAGLPYPESQEQGFHLALGTASSGSAICIWYQPEEGSVSATAGTGKGTARESHGTGAASQASPLRAAPVPGWH